MTTENKPRRRPNYQSYLLRLWRDGPSGDWRASLEDTATGQRHPFASFERLVEFLDRQIKPDSPTDAGRSEPGNPSEKEAK